MLKHIACSWLYTYTALTQRFKFVFLVPMWLVRGHSMADIICDDLRLIPIRCKKEILDLSHNQVLFFLDSYEELHLENDECEDITGEGQQ